MQNEVLMFIQEFGNYADGKYYEALYDVFMCKYCYHFAHLLKETFKRGSVCLCAPKGHWIWMDDKTNTPYDFWGDASDEECYYFIPEEYWGDLVTDFLHIPTITPHNATKQEIIDIMKKYCKDNYIEYNSECENF